MRAYGISCGGVTRCNHAAPTVSASRRCLASWGYCNSAEPRRSLVRESAVKPVGKPDALIGHVRLDERGWETGRRSVRQYSRPSSTLQVWAIRTFAHREQQKKTGTRSVFHHYRTLVS